MKEEYSKRLIWAAKMRKPIQRLFQQWKKSHPSEIDGHFEREHDRAFEQTDCLECANCCRTTSPIFKERDIVRIAKHLQMSVGHFSSKYLERDEEGDWVLQWAPCPFLELETNACTIYAERPQACRDFPHTDRKNMHQILRITEQNTHLCPAVSKMVQSILAEVND